MSSSLQFFLSPTPDQALRLRRLQKEFAAACNFITPVAQANHCWNRVALHHLVYRELRSRFPQLGSQMACNAIYSVSRTYRLLLQHPKSPCNAEQHPHCALPLLHFRDNGPVYFDRHTLSIKAEQLSMYSLDGRLHFQIRLTDSDACSFDQERLREIVLRRSGNQYLLQFWLADKAALLAKELRAELPEYVLLRAVESLPSPMQSNPAPAPVALSV